nr:hypothetical protein [Deltaproteobacteria bacterium]
MGLATTLPPREIAATASVDLAATPGGSSQVHFNPRNYGLTVRPISTDGAFTRVLLQHWTSFAIVGWLPTAALSGRGLRQRRDPGRPRLQATAARSPCAAPRST